MSDLHIAVDKANEKRSKNSGAMVMAHIELLRGVVLSTDHWNAVSGKHVSVQKQNHNK